jgi:hypothetical protein
MESEIASSGVGYKKSISAYHCPDRQGTGTRQILGRKGTPLLFPKAFAFFSSTF